MGVAGLDFVTFVLPSKKCRVRQLLLNLFWITAELFLAQRPALPLRLWSMEKKEAVLNYWLNLSKIQQAKGAGLSLYFRKTLEIKINKSTGSAAGPNI